MYIDWGLLLTATGDPSGWRLVSGSTDVGLLPADSSLCVSHLLGIAFQDWCVVVRLLPELTGISSIRNNAKLLV